MTDALDQLRRKYDPLAYFNAPRRPAFPPAVKPPATSTPSASSRTITKTERDRLWGLTILALGGMGESGGGNGLAARISRRDPGAFDELLRRLPPCENTLSPYVVKIIQSQLTPK